MNTYYIYEITNKINGKTYIGQRHCPENKTPWTDTKYMGSGVYLKSAKEKYGIKNFSKEIIAICYDQKILDVLEKHYIYYFKSIGKAEYNIAPGGTGGDGNWTFLPEDKQKLIRDKISKANKGKIITEHYRKKISEAMKGKPSPNKGNVFSEEMRRKCSESQKKRYENYEEHIKISEGLRNSEKFKRSHNDPKFRQKMSEVNMGKHLSLKTKLKISNSRKGKKMPKSFSEKMSMIMKGRVISEEHKRKISESNKGKHKDYLFDTKWWNDGVKNYRSVECPFEGCVLGRLNFNNVGSKGMHWYNNGVDECLAKECPEGFVYGKLKRNR